MMTNKAIDARPGRRQGPGLSLAFGPLAHTLAVLDAIALQSLGVYWVTTWPRHGGVVGAVTATLLLWWAAKRGARALWAVDEYRWMSRHLARLVVFGLALQLVAWLLHLW